jgi:hypothetical protein
MRFLLAVALVAASLAQTYSGPQPSKADIPYLLHAGRLLPTEVLEAKENQQKDASVYTMPGEHSPVKTPLASPIFILKANQLNPEQLQLFQLQTADGHREIKFSKKKNPQPYTFTVKKLDAGIFRLEVNESLPVGEYSITPTQSNQTFCFAVF